MKRNQLFLEPTKRPETLFFTAPFRLCKGQCKPNVSNYFMQFPLYIGIKRNKNIYQNLYSRDHKHIHSTRDNAPFRKRTTKTPYKICPSKKEPFMPSKCPVKVSTVTYIKQKHEAKSVPLRQHDYSLTKTTFEQLFPSTLHRYHKTYRNFW